MNEEATLTREDTGEEGTYAPTGPAEWTWPEEGNEKKLQCCRRLPGSQAPYLMCWRTFRPEDVDDRDAESMSSAGNNNI